MNANRPRSDAATRLGDLLYSELPAPLERDWVRLVEAVAAGDQLALRALYERSHRLVFTLAARICGNRELAEEVTLDVFHDVWRRAGDYDASNGSVVGWIMNQARSRAIDRLRFEHRKKRTAPSHEHFEAFADPVNGHAQRRLLHDALSVLTDDERAAIEIAFFGELSYAETAERLGQPIGTVKTRVRSALAKLRKALGRQGGVR